MFEFMQMGDYTFYVWASVCSVIAVMSVMSWRAHAQFKRVRKAIAWSRDVQR